MFASSSYSLTFTPVIGSMRSALTASVDSSESTVWPGMSFRIGLENDERTWGMSVSYTHLTLPTKRIV